MKGIDIGLGCIQKAHQCFILQSLLICILHLTHQPAEQTHHLRSAIRLVLLYEILQVFFYPFQTVNDRVRKIPVEDDLIKHIAVGIGTSVMFQVQLIPG